MTAMGISGSPAQANSFSGNFGRRDSISSANSGSIDESAIEDDVGPIQSTPNTPFARRMSFGARALRDVKNNTNAGGGGTAGGTDKSNGRSSIAEASHSGGGRDSAKKTARLVDAAPTSNKGRGLSSSEKMLPCPLTMPKRVYGSNANYCSTIGDGYNWADNFRNRAERSSSIASLSGSPLAGNHVRAKSVATMQPPAQEMPKPKAGPDHIEERILRGQFGDAF